MIKEAIIKLSKKEDLSYEMAQAVMDEIMSGEANDIQKSAYLTALAMKGETIDEITASAAGMREHCTRLLNDMDVLEIVETGGDRSIPLIFLQLLHLSFPLEEFRLQSMETERLPVNVVRQMC